MSRLHRAAAAVLFGVLAAGSAVTARAQVTGMPLFTNPRFGSGIRFHADVGQPTSKGTSVGDLTVVQAGVTLALGGLGIDLTGGTNLNTARTLSGGGTVNANNNYTASALAQLRLLGGGLNPLSLSVFGGASTDVNALEVTAASLKVKYPKLMNFPVGAALGLHLPMGLSLWGAGRYVFTKFVNCPSTDPAGFPGLSQMCSNTDKQFRWAAGVDLPLLPILSIRAGYDSGKVLGQTVSYWGVGASIGLGGMR